jgi:hypothetical protein
VREEVVRAAPAILAAHGIAEDRSLDIRDRATLPQSCHDILAGTLGKDAMPAAFDPNAASALPIEAD